ncbi:MULTISPECIES: cofactor assembly of complex C subunit B [Prochlorococcus]|uniref:cofactor assembly of complex C subunit B n=1 Tax=Prochlorococcus TaxID=1218 RepID=UPI000533A7E8|nr:MULTISPECIES: cofactor assembly of complex C subunit B [Prochlorococcus]KGG12428.1 hypothetical protein EV05_1640 [Prochlorococcus sp. MIT 0601]
MSRNIIISLGIIFSLLNIANFFSISRITPSLQRSEVLSALASVIILLIGITWSEINPKKITREDLQGVEGFFLEKDLTTSQKLELAWGSQMLLTATAASTILIYWEGDTILRRGLISHIKFVPKDICLRAQREQLLVSLVNTRFYPGSSEFDPVLPNLPSVLIYPLAQNGFLIIGGWKARCFTKSDEKWIEGWSQKLIANVMND